MKRQTIIKKTFCRSNDRFGLNSDINLLGFPMSAYHAALGSIKIIGTSVIAQSTAGGTAHSTFLDGTQSGGIFLLTLGQEHFSGALEQYPYYKK